MNKKNLFDIPIYSRSEKDFNNKWGKKFESLKSKFIRGGHTSDKAEQYVHMIFHPQNIWKYNQIIGYIQISITSSDISFELYYPENKKKYYVQSKNKIFMVNQSINGMHFPINDKSNEEIRNEIKKYLEIIEKLYISEIRYIDYEVFDNMIDFVDINGIIETLH